MIKFLSSFFGLGFLPLVPGTWGTIGAIPIYFMLGLFNVNLLKFIVIFTLISTYLSYKAACEVGEEDPSFVVVDEVVGMLVTLLWIKTTYIWAEVLFGFILFRIFDIVKPFPAYQSQRIPYGVGIMLDDIIAGIYANIVLKTMILWGVLDRLHCFFPNFIR